MLDVRWSSWPRTWGDVTMISFPMMDDEIVVGIRMKYLSVSFFFKGFRCAFPMCNKDKLRFVGQLVLYHKELQTEVAFFLARERLNGMIIPVVREIPMVMHHRSPVNTGTPKLDG